MTADLGKGVRWSACVSCKRRGAYQQLRAPRREFSQETLDLFNIRSIQNDGLVAKRAEELRFLGCNVALELELPWACGTGHVDLANLTDHVLEEWTGTKDAELDIRKVMQVVGYTEFAEREFGVACEDGVDRPWQGVVVAFDPSSGKQRRYPIDIEANRHRVREIEDEMYEALRELDGEGDLPERVCRTPRDGPAMFCEMRDYCFRDFDEEQLEIIDGDEAAQAAIKVADLTDRAAVTKGDLAAVTKQLKEAQLELAVLVPAGEKYKVGDIEVKIVEIKDTESLPLGAIRTAGVEIPLQLEEFITRSGAHRRFYLRRLS